MTVESFIHQMETILNSGDPAQAIRFFSRDDQDFYEHMERKLAGIAASVNPDTHLRLKSVSSGADSVTALVFIDRSYDYHDRRVQAAYWVEWRLAEGEDGWRITGEDIRDYAAPRQMDLDVELFPERGEIEGTAVIRYEVVLPGEDNLVLSLNRGLAIESLTDGTGRDLYYERTGHISVISMGRAFETGDTGEIRVTFRGAFFNESKENGYNQVHIGPEGSFASWVTHWYPRLDCESSKCPGELSYTVPMGITVVSSGRKLATEETGGKSVQRFTVSRPLDVSFAAAEYTFLNRRIPNVDVGAYFLGGALRNAEEYIQTCSEMIEFFIDVYGFYPYDQYAVVEIPREVVGGMGGSSEQGMNLFPVGMLPETSMNEYVIAHEIGHSWWGNLVGGETIISEALAQYSGTLWLEHRYGEPALRSVLKDGFITGSSQCSDSYFYFISENPRGDLPLGVRTPANAGRLHALADTKGHFVYHMLRDQIGRDAMENGFRRILDRYAGKTLTVPEMRDIFESVSGQDLDLFFQQWFFRTGAPEFTMTREIRGTAEGCTVSGLISQSGDFYAVHAEIGVFSDGTWTYYPVDITESPQPYELNLAVKPERVAFDPRYRLLRWTPELRQLQELKSIRTLLAVHQDAAALERVQALLNDVPDSLRARRLLGEIYMDLDRSGDAVTIFADTIRRHHRESTGVFTREIPAMWLALGNAYDLLGLREPAQQAYGTVADDPVMPSEFRSRAADYLATPYEQQKRFSLSRDELAEFVAPYLLQAQVYDLQLNADGILEAITPDGLAWPLIPCEKDRFSILGNSHLELRFIRNSEGSVVSLSVFRQGSRMFSLARSTDQ